MTPGHYSTGVIIRRYTGIPSTQTNLCMTSSKDTLQVIRLAVLLHVTEGYLRLALNRSDQPPALEVPRETLSKARKLYSVMAKQKSAFIQVCSFYLNIHSVLEFQEKVTYC